MSFDDEWLETSMQRRIRISMIVSYVRHPRNGLTKLSLSDGTTCSVETTPEEIDFLLGRIEK
jgi:hypothetical protein